MARKRPAGSRKAKKRPSPKRRREPWIQAVWGQSVPNPKKLTEAKVRLRLRQRPGKARTITVTYALTKKALGK